MEDRGKGADGRREEMRFINLRARYILDWDRLSIFLWKKLVYWNFFFTFFWWQLGPIEFMWRKQFRRQGEKR